MQVHNKPLNKTCLTCGVLFHVKPSHASARKTCSRACSNKFKQQYAGERSSTWKGGHIKVSGHKVGAHGKYQHRIVMEARLGRPLKSNEIVHHIDHNKLNNSPDNLQLLSRAEHVKVHFPNGLWRHRQNAHT